LNERECVIIKNWFAKRYIRNAFPTEFNIRTRTATDVLMKSLKSDSNLDLLLGVYLTLDPSDQEFSDLDEPYDINVCFLVKETGLQDEAIKK